MPISRKPSKDWDWPKTKATAPEKEKTPETQEQEWEKATGEALDRYAEMHGVQRMKGEPDEQLRRVLLTSINTQLSEDTARKLIAAFEHLDKWAKLK